MSSADIETEHWKWQNPGNHFKMRSSILSQPMFHFYTPWKRQKTKGLLTFSGGIEMELWVLRLLKNIEINGDIDTNLS